MSIDINNIKQNYPIVEVARRLGIDVLNNNTCRCANPLHEDKNPSMSFHIQSNTFKCFSCGVSGSNIDLVILVVGGDFKNALEFITSQRLFDNPQKQSSKYIASKTNINNTNKKIEHTKLYKAFLNYLDDYKAEANKYLHTRGLDKSTIDKYAITTLPSDYPTQLEILTTLRKSYSDDELVQSGLYKISQKGNIYNTFFAHRLIIPYISLGEVVSIQGRTIDKNDVRSKYIFLKGSSSSIFNIDILDKLQVDSSIIITEGVLDALSWIALGFNAIAIGSSTNIAKISGDIIQKLKHHKIFTAGDSDKAGLLMNDKLQKLLDKQNIVKYQSINLQSVAKAFNIENTQSINDINDILTSIKFETDELGSLGLVKYTRCGTNKILFLGYGTLDASEIDVLKSNNELEIILKLKKAFEGDITLFK